MVSKVEFWSDHIDVPKPVFRKLSDDKIKAMMIKALEQHEGDGDIFAVRSTIDSEQWIEDKFVFVKIDGVITEDKD